MMRQLGEALRYKPPGRTMALRSTRPLADMGTRNISWGGKRGRCVGQTILQTSCTDFLAVWEPNLLYPSGPDQTCTRIALLYQECTNLWLQLAGNTIYSSIAYLRVVTIKLVL